MPGSATADSRPIDWQELMAWLRENDPTTERFTRWSCNEIAARSTTPLRYPSPAGRFAVTGRCARHSATLNLRVTSGKRDNFA